jgi:hypothetical protein
MFHLLPLLATVLTPLLLAAGGRAAPAPAPHEENRIEQAERITEHAAEAHGLGAVLAAERVAANVAADVARHDPVLRKRGGAGVVEVLVKRDVAAAATNVRLAREKRWGGGGGGWGNNRGGCCGGCPGSRGGW